MLSEGRERVDGADEGGELEAAGSGTRRGLELLRVAEPPAADPRGPAHGGCGEQEHSSQRSGGTERADGAGGGEESEAAGGGSRRGVELQEVGEQPNDGSGWGRDRVLCSDSKARQSPCGGDNTSTKTTSPTTATEGGCWVQASSAAGSPCQAPSRSNGCGSQLPSYNQRPRSTLQSPPLPLLSPLAVPAGLQMRALEVQAVLLVTWSLGWRRVCLVPG